MVKKSTIASSMVLLLFAAAGLGLVVKKSPVKENNVPAVSWDANTPVWEVLKQFGETPPASRPSTPNQEDIKRGMEIYTTGVTVGPDNKKISKQSKYYVCTSCHNSVKEDPDLRVSDPEKRIDYCNTNNLPFLQGTTMYGTINKVSWYNGDYVLKYGDLVKDANKSIEAAIHLCATVCSQGRDLNEWEMKSMMAYFWSLEYKLGDLSLTEADWAKLREAGNAGGANPAMATWVKTFYLQGSPATFGAEPADRSEGYKTTRTPDVERGHLLYKLSCLSCHSYGGVSQGLTLGEDKTSLQLLAKNIEKDNSMSLYHVVRSGTHPEAGAEAYMPHFPLERMNDQQVEDLRAYIVKGAN